MVYLCSPDVRTGGRDGRRGIIERERGTSVERERNAFACVTRHYAFALALWRGSANLIQAWRKAGREALPRT